MESGYLVSSNPNGCKNITGTTCQISCFPTPAPLVVLHRLIARKEEVKVTKLPIALCLVDHLQARRPLSADSTLSSWRFTATARPLPSVENRYIIASKIKNHALLTP